MKDLHMYVDDGNVNTVIAHSPEDADAVLGEHIGEKVDALWDIDWHQLPDDEMVALYCDLAFDDDEIPPGRKCVPADNQAMWEWCATATAKEWVTLRGREFFSSTEN